MNYLRHMNVTKLGTWTDNIHYHVAAWTYDLNESLLIMLCYAMLYF